MTVKPTRNIKGWAASLSLWIALGLLLVPRVWAKSDFDKITKAIAERKNEVVLKAIESGELSNEAEMPAGYSLLSAAVIAGNRDLVQKLLELGSPAPAVDQKGRTSIFYAVEAGDSILVNELAERSGDLGRQDKNGDTLMHLAVKEKLPDMVQELLRLGVSLEKENLEGQRPVMVAIGKIHPATLRAVISAGADLKQPNSKDETPFAQILKLGKEGLPLIQVFAEAGYNLNDNDEKGQTLLHHLAGMKGFKKGELVPLVAQLVAYGADANHADGKGQTPLKWAMEQDNKELALALEKVGGQLTDGPLKPLVIKEKDKKVDLAAPEPEKEDESTKADFAKNEKTEVGLGDASISPSSALLLAARLGDVNTLKEVLKEKVDVNSLDRMGFAAIHFMAQNGSPDGLEALIKAGAKVNVKGGNLGETPLHLAVRNGNAEAVAVLLKAKADVAVKTSKGQTPLDYAEAGENKDVADLLKGRGKRGGN